MTRGDQARPSQYFRLRLHIRVQGTGLYSDVETLPKAVPQAGDHSRELRCLPKAGSEGCNVGSQVRKCLSAQGPLQQTRIKVQENGSVLQESPEGPSLGAADKFFAREQNLVVKGGGKAGMTAMEPVTASLPVCRAGEVGFDPEQCQTLLQSC